MAAQSKHAKAMQENFSEEDNQAYGEYFDLFQKHLQTNFCATNLNQVTSYGWEHKQELYITFFW